MRFLLGSTHTLFIAACLLVIVASLPALPKLEGSAGRRAPAILLASLAAAFALLWCGFDRGPLLPDEFPAKIARYATLELRAAKEPNVVVLEGASYVQNGVDDKIIADELKQLGYSAHVVRMAAGAANHFERYQMQRDAVQRLRGKSSPDQRWIIMPEVQSGYDRIPIAQFDSNQDTGRAYHYMNAVSARYIARALRSPDVDVALKGAWQWPLFRHVLINTFSAGAANRYVAEELLEVGGGEASDRLPQKFKWGGLGSMIKEARRRPKKVKPYPWLLSVREARLKRLWADYATAFVYFGLPTTDLDQLQYVRGFCAAVKSPCITPADVELLTALDDRSMWHDKSHLVRAGAELYSRYLARQLAALGLLRK